MIILALTWWSKQQNILSNELQVPLSAIFPVERLLNSTSLSAHLLGIIDKDTRILREYES